jgi:hypothetical protein
LFTLGASLCCVGFGDGGADLSRCSGHFGDAPQEVTEVSAVRRMGEDGDDERGSDHGAAALAMRVPVELVSCVSGL